MAVNCFADTCSTTVTEVTTVEGPKYAIDVNFVPETGSIVCTEGEGLGVLISGNPGNRIDRLSNGLYVGLPDSFVGDFSGNPALLGVGPGSDASSPQSSAVYSIQNTSGEDALIVVEGEFNFTYAVLGSANAFNYSAGVGQKAGALNPATGPDLQPFNAQLAMRLFASVGAAGSPATAVHRQNASLSGVVEVSVDTSAEIKSERRQFVHAERVPAGQYLNIRGDAFFDGPSQTINVVGTSASGTIVGAGGTGFELWNGHYSVIPI